MKGITYFQRDGFSINEGSGPLNIHLSWRKWHTTNGYKRIWYFYFYAFGYRWSYFSGR